MKLQKILLAALAITSTNAFATDGYFAHGYGVKSQGMGGVGIALPQDALAAATNPAGMGLIGDRIDFGATWFRPIRESEIVGNVNFDANGHSADGIYKANDTKNFIIPEFGYNKVINDQLTLGVSVYGNGGMNTDYKNGVPLFDGMGHRAGVDLIQLFIAPTATWKINPSNTIGISVNFAYQRFEAKGLQNFTGQYGNTSPSESPNNITDKGHDNSYGAGLKFGWIGQINDQVSVGATYQTKTYMSKFDKYKGLFAEGGDFDVPANYGVGLAVKATPALTVAADLERIEYGDIKSINNPLLPNFASGARLGDSGGAGFGWRDVTVTKIGASYAYSDSLTLRAGYNHSTQPIPKSETFFNILAPGVVQDHLTLGATWTLSDKSELSVSYMHAFENSVKGLNSIPGFGGGEANLKMYEDSISVAYGWKI